MSTEQRLALAEELVSLTYRKKPVPENAPHEFARLMQKRLGQIFEIQTRLHAEYLDTEMLEAALAFWKSDTGTALLAAQQKITAELNKRLAKIRSSEEQEKIPGSAPGMQESKGDLH